MRKRILFTALSVLVTAGAFAQGEGLAGINEATSLMTSYFDPATKLCYAIAAVLLAVVILYLAGAGQWTCILGGIFAGSLLAWGVFRLNARFGEHGLMKMLAEKRHPRYLIRRRKIFRMLNPERKP